MTINISASNNLNQQRVNFGTKQKKIAEKIKEEARLAFLDIMSSPSSEIIKKTSQTQKMFISTTALLPAFCDKSSNKPLNREIFKVLADFKVSSEAEREKLNKVDDKTILNLGKLYQDSGSSSSIVNKFDKELYSVKKKFKLDIAETELLRKHIAEKKAMETVAENVEDIKKRFLSDMPVSPQILIAVGNLYQAVNELDKSKSEQETKDFRDKKFSFVDKSFIDDSIKYDFSKNEIKTILNARLPEQLRDNTESIIQKKISIKNIDSMPETYSSERVVVLSQVLAEHKMEYSQLSDEEKDLLEVLLKLDSPKAINESKQSQLAHKSIEVLNVLRENKAFEDADYQERLEIFGKSASRLLENKFCAPLAISTLLGPSGSAQYSCDITPMPIRPEDGKPSSYLKKFEEYRKDVALRASVGLTLAQHFIVGAGSYADMMCHLRSQYGDNNYPPDTEVGVYHNELTNEVKSAFIASSYNTYSKTVKYIDAEGNKKELDLGEREYINAKGEHMHSAFVSKKYNYSWDHYATRIVANRHSFDNSRGSGQEILSGIKELVDYDGLVEIKPSGKSTERLLGRVNKDNSMEILFYAPNGIHQNKPFELYPLVN